MGNWDISKCFRGDGPFLLSGKRDILCSGRRDILFSGKREILSSGNDFILWESGHLSSGNRTTYPLGFGTSSGKRDMGNGTLYPLGIGPLILWETGISVHLVFFSVHLVFFSTRALDSAGPSAERCRGTTGCTQPPGSILYNYSASTVSREGVAV